jgi:hypothetical protein
VLVDTRRNVCGFQCGHNNQAVALHGKIIGGGLGFLTSFSRKLQAFAWSLSQKASQTRKSGIGEIQFSVVLTRLMAQFCALNCDAKQRL